jgi:rare lipoprotein A
LGTRVRVIRSDNNKAVTVLVNDRCADHAGGIIDLSKAAATELGFIHAGKTSVKLELIDEGLSAEELANARYTVQIAAAPTVEELYPTLSALSEKGYANITLEYTSQTTPPEYQIIMGPYKNKGNAELLRTAFSRENFSAKVRDKDAIK